MNARQWALVPIAAFTAQGNSERLKLALEAGLKAGLTVNEIREVLVHLYAYCGFPRSLAALGVFVALLDDRKKAGKQDVVGRDASPLPEGRTLLELGTEVQTLIAGRPVSGPTYDFAPIINVYLREHLFGALFARDLLDFQERELVTISALASLPAEVYLGSHLKASLNVGVSPDDLRTFVSVLAQTVGPAEATLAATSVEAVLAARFTPPKAGSTGVLPHER